jgi:hypothetical protein
LHQARKLAAREGATPPTLVASNVGAVRIHPVRVHVDCNAAINVHSDGPIVVTLAGCWSDEVDRSD